MRRLESFRNRLPCRCIFTFVVAVAWVSPVRRAAPFRAEVREVNGPVYQDECVELFVSDPLVPFRYVEVVVNPGGVLYGARVEDVCPHAKGEGR